MPESLPVEPTITLTLTELNALLAAARRAPPANDVAVTPVAAAAPAAPAVPQYLETKAAAALLGVSPKGLEAMRARGEGPPFIRVGRRVRYVASELGRRKAG